MYRFSNAEHADVFDQQYGDFLNSKFNTDVLKAKQSKIIADLFAASILEISILVKVSLLGLPTVTEILAVAKVAVCSGCQT